jgi:hypothetical protein
MELQRYVQLWGGPMDGEHVWMPRGELPARIGMHRTARDELVVIRGRAILNMPLTPAHLDVYEHAPVPLWRSVWGDWTCVGALPAGLLYVHADLITRWAARP